MLETILMAVMAALPALTSIIGIIAALLKATQNNKETSEQLAIKFENLQQKVLDTKEYEDLKAQLLIAHQENLELKHKINELLTAIDKVARE